MTDEQKTVAEPQTPATAPVSTDPAAAAAPSAGAMRPGRGGRGGDRGGNRRGGPRRRSGRDRGPEEESEFEQKIIDLARVTRVMAGGKRMRFRACLVLGDKAGRVGFGLAKGADVSIAINKSTAQAKKHMITVPIVKETIPYQTSVKFKAAQILFKPAKPGTGIIAGGAIREVLEMAGIPNIVAKMMGTNNKVTNVKATMKALEDLATSPLAQKLVAKAAAKAAKDGTTKEAKKKPRLRAAHFE